MTSMSCAKARATLAAKVESYSLTTTDKAVAMIRAAAVFGTRTLTKDLLGKAIHAVATQGIKEGFQIPVDILQSTARAAFAKTVEGKEFAPSAYRTLASGLNAEGLNAAKMGFQKGWQATIDNWKNNPEAEALVGELFSPQDLGNPVVTALVNLPGKLISATGRPWYNMTVQLSLVNDARVMAMNMGLKGEAATAKVNELLANPTEEMLLTAADRGAKVIFSNNTMLGDVTSAIRQGSALKRSPEAQAIYRIAANTVIPVAKVPAAVFTRGAIDLNPIGALLRPLAKNLTSSQREVAAVEALGNASAGMALIAIGMSYARQNMMTGPRQASSAQGNVTEATGANEMAIKIGGQWVGLTALLGPLAIPVGIGAGIEWLRRDKRDPTGNPYRNALATGAQLFSEHSFLENAQRIGDAAKHLDASGVASSFVPTPQILRQASNIASGGQTRVKQGFVDKVAADWIPGYAAGWYGKGLPGKVDVFGKPVMRTQGGTLGAMQELFDPSLTRPSKSTLVTDELQRLGIGIATAGKKLSMPGGEPLERSAANRNAGRAVVGPLLEKMLTPIVTSPGYATAPDDVKRKILERVVARGHKIDQQLARAAGVQARRAQP